MFKKLWNRKGFTLIELIVIMAVIGVLVLLAIPKFMGYTEKARLTEIKNNIKQIETASERYYIDHQDWPRASSEPYTAEQIESFAQEIKNKTGQIVTLESDGDYYEISYDKLQKYVQKPKDGIHYILQNPIGEVFYLDRLTSIGENTLKQNTSNSNSNTNTKPIAVITMTPNSNITTETNLIWGYENSTDADGNEIVNAEWECADVRYTTPGSYTTRLRVQDSKGLWSDWVSITFNVNNPAPSGMQGYSLPIGTVASSTDTYTNFYPNNALDGNMSTKWLARGNSGTIQFSFPTPQTFKGVQIAISADNNSSETHIIYGLKNGQYIKIGSHTATISGVPTPTTIPVSAGTYDAIKISGTATSSWINLFEISLID